MSLLARFLLSFALVAVTSVQLKPQLRPDAPSPWMGDRMSSRTMWSPSSAHAPGPRLNFKIRLQSPALAPPCPSVLFPLQSKRSSPSSRMRSKVRTSIPRTCLYVNVGARAVSQCKNTAIDDLERGNEQNVSKKIEHNSVIMCAHSYTQGSHVSTVSIFFRTPASIYNLIIHA